MFGFGEFRLFAICGTLDFGILGFGELWIFDFGFFFASLKALGLLVPGYLGSVGPVALEPMGSGANGHTKPRVPGPTGSCVSNRTIT